MRGIERKNRMEGAKNAQNELRNAGNIKSIDNKMGQCAMNMRCNPNPSDNDTARYANHSGKDVGGAILENQMRQKEIQRNPSIENRTAINSFKQAPATAGDVGSKILAANLNAQRFNK